MKETIKKGVIFGLTSALTMILIGLTYAAITHVSSGETLTASKFNELIDATVPSGEVSAFNLTTCPTGWTEYIPAYGRFIRGIDKSGTSIDPDGQRSLEDYQSDDFKNHTHGINLWDTDGTTQKVARNGAGSYVGVIVSGGTGGSETRPKNVALLYCVKQ